MVNVQVEGAVSLLKGLRSQVFESSLKEFMWKNCERKAVGTDQDGKWEVNFTFGRWRVNNPEWKEERNEGCQKSLQTRAENRIKHQLSFDHSHDVFDWSVASWDYFFPAEDNKNDKKTNDDNDKYYPKDIFEQRVFIGFVIIFPHDRLDNGSLESGLGDQFAIHDW